MTVNGTCPECGTDYERTNTEEFTCSCGWQELQPVDDSGESKVATERPKTKRKAGAQQES